MRILISAVLVCGTALAASAQDVSGARDASQRFLAALSSGDAATASSFFAEDGVALPPGRGELSGKSDIERFYGNMTRSVKELKYVPESQKPVADGTIREIGSFSFKPQKQGAADVTGKYLVIWTKVGSDWKISADMWNRSSQGGGGKQGGARRGAGGAGGTGGGAGGTGGGAEE